MRPEQAQIPRSGARLYALPAIAAAWLAGGGADRLWLDSRFRAALGARWRELQAGGLGRELLTRLDEHRRVLEAGAAGRNLRRWPTLRRLLWQSPAVRGGYGAEVAHLRRWLTRRMAWLDRGARRLGC